MSSRPETVEQEISRPSLDTRTTNMGPNGSGTFSLGRIS
jgi:hypothetical protein